jgi:hypothetical protein
MYLMSILVRGRQGIGMDMMYSCTSWYIGVDIVIDREGYVYIPSIYTGYTTVQYVWCTHPHRHT